MSGVTHAGCAAIRPRNYSRTCIKVLALYLLFWVPGLIANLIYYKESRHMQASTGKNLPGVRWLALMLWFGAVIPIVTVGFLTYVDYVYPAIQPPAPLNHALQIRYMRKQNQKNDRIAYLNNVVVKELEIGKTVIGSTSVNGKIKNKGDKALTKVELTIDGFDLKGKVVFSRKYNPVDCSIWHYAESDALEPDEVQEFGVPLDDIPPNWAYTVKAKITDVRFDRE